MLPSPTAEPAAARMNPRREFQCARGTVGRASAMEDPWDAVSRKQAAAVMERINGQSGLTIQETIQETT
jgi:hypothetical protein